MSLFRRRSIVTIFIALLFVGFHLANSYDNQYRAEKSYDFSMKRKQGQMLLVTSMATSLFISGDSNSAIEHLADAMNLRLIDFFVIHRKGEVLSFDQKSAMFSRNEFLRLSPEAQATLLAEHPTNVTLQFDAPSGDVTVSESDRASVEHRFVAMEIEPGTYLTAGLIGEREQYLQFILRTYEREVSQTLSLFIGLAFLLFLLASKDLLRVAQAIKSGRLGAIRNITALSAEAEVLKRGVEGYELAVGNLRKENQVLGAQVLPSLKTEIQSGKKPPYDFDCTMVRTDINNFTQIFNNHPLEEFIETINEFFVECSHIISRWDGLIHEFVGDEIIFYFKDEKHANSFTAALACVNEINRAADRIHQRTTAQRGYGFRVKSSLAHGKIRFGRFLNGYSLAGAPLIETTRILSHVSEKNENSVHFDFGNFSKLHEDIRFEDSFRATLKGMPGERRILRYLGHSPVAEAWSKSTTWHPRFHDYRSDEDLCYWLNRIAARDVQDELIAKFLSSFVVTRSDSAVTAFALEAIEDRIETAAQPDRTLANLASALRSLVPLDQVSMELENVLATLLQSSDSRVVANAIETVEHFKMARLSNAARRLAYSDDNRVAANALVLHGADEVSKPVIQRLKKLLASGNPTYVSSAIYAMGEIARKLRARDLVYFSTQSDFLALSQTLPQHSKSPDLNVRRQCLMAAEKFGDELLLAKVQKRLGAKSVAELLENERRKSAI